MAISHWCCGGLGGTPANVFNIQQLRPIGSPLMIYAITGRHWWLQVFKPIKDVTTFKDWTAYYSKMEKRVCRTCNEEKDVSCFSKDRSLYRLDCSKCVYQKYKTKHAEYYESNKEHYHERRCEKTTCECGISLRRDSISRHQTTKKHLELMTKQ